MTVQRKTTSVSLAGSNALKSAEMPVSEKKAVKARLLLKLIKEGTIPRPPDSFLKELQSIASRKKATESSDLKDRVRGLAAHLQSLNKAKAPSMPSARAPSKDGGREINGSSAQKPIAPVVAPPSASPPAPPSSLQDQHPAVIQRQLEKLDGEERATQLRALPGETARQVSLLTWQSKQK